MKKRLFVVVFLVFLSVNTFARFDPGYLSWRFLDNMPLYDFDAWGGNKTTCSLELRNAIASVTSDRFDLLDFFQITDISGNESKDDDEFWEYIFWNYESIIKASLTPGDVNIFWAPISYFDGTTFGLFMVSRYNGGNKSDPNSFRLYLYFYLVQWM